MVDRLWLVALLALIPSTAAFADDDDDDDDDEVPVAQKPRFETQPIANLVGAIASKRVEAITALLHDTVQQDVAFGDARCAKEFPTPSTVAAANIPAFARCLATLVDVKAGPTPTLIVHGPGIELEARAVTGKVFFIGSHAEGRIVVEPKTLETLRTGGSSNVDDVVAKRLDFIVKRRNMPVSTWIALCLDADGGVAGVSAQDTLANVGGVFEDALRTTWKFKPFTYGGIKRPVCSLTHVAYPAGTRAHVGPRPKRPDPALPPSLRPPVNVASQALEEYRIAGDKEIFPDKKTEKQITKDKKDRVIGAWKFCLGLDGTINGLQALRTTGYPDYDKKIEKAIGKWKYKPYLDGADQAIKVCTAVTFIWQKK